MHLKCRLQNWRPSCLGLKVLTVDVRINITWSRRQFGLTSSHPWDLYKIVVIQRNLVRRHVYLSRQHNVCWWLVYLLKEWWQSQGTVYYILLKYEYEDIKKEYCRSSMVMPYYETHIQYANCPHCPKQYFNNNNFPLCLIAYRILRTLW